MLCAPLPTLYWTVFISSSSNKNCTLRNQYGKSCQSTQCTMGRFCISFVCFWSVLGKLYKSCFQTCSANVSCRSLNSGYSACSAVTRSPKPSMTLVLQKRSILHTEPTWEDIGRHSSGRSRLQCFKSDQRARRRECIYLRPRHGALLLRWIARKWHWNRWSSTYPCPMVLSVCQMFQWIN